MLCFIVWYSFLVGHVVNNVRGFFRAMSYYRVLPIFCSGIPVIYVICVEANWAADDLTIRASMSGILTKPRNPDPRCTGTAGSAPTIVAPRSACWPCADDAAGSPRSGFGWAIPLAVWPYSCIFCAAFSCVDGTADDTKPTQRVCTLGALCTLACWLAAAPAFAGEADFDRRTSMSTVIPNFGRQRTSKVLGLSQTLA